MTNSTVFESPDFVLVADPCWTPGEVARIREHVAAAKPGIPRFLLLTHSDYDHVLGYGAFPGAQVIAGRRLSEKHAREREAILDQIRRMDDEYYWQRDYPIEYPRVDIAVDESDEDGLRLERGETRLRVFPAPGHTDDGIFAAIEPDGILLAGDYLSDAEPPVIEQGTEAYLRTLDRLESVIRRHDIRLLLPGHGNATADRSDMLQRIESSRRYIRQLTDAVTHGNPSALEPLIDGFPFPRSARSIHEANVNIVQRELGET